MKPMLKKSLFALIALALVGAGIYLSLLHI